MQGRFASGQTSWVIRFARGFGGWTSEQQTLHAHAWIRLLADTRWLLPKTLSITACTRRSWRLH